MDEIVAQEQRKANLRIKLIERFKNMSLRRNKEYEILNEEKYRQFIDRNEVSFGSFLNEAVRKLEKELNLGEKVVTLIEDYINNQDKDIQE